MKRPALTAILTIILAGSLIGSAFAGGAYSISRAYNMDKAEQGFVTYNKNPSAARVMADAAIGRPVGLVTTTIGIGVFLVTLPFTAPSHSVDIAAENLIHRPGGWTFTRPLGQDDERFDSRGVFGQ